MSPFDRRPERAERLAKLQLARRAFESRELLFARSATRDLVALNWNEQDDVDKGLAHVFEEIGPNDYQGERPPMIADAPDIRGAELFPFVWNSEFRGERMYFKLAFSKKGTVWVVRLHPSTVR